MQGTTSSAMSGLLFVMQVMGSDKPRQSFHLLAVSLHWALLVISVVAYDWATTGVIYGLGEHAGACS